MQRRLIFLANFAYAILVYRRNNHEMRGEPELPGDQDGRGGETDPLLAQ